jgi:predicted membrane channel-forming protein YqfA (hemolysin III family)
MNPNPHQPSWRKPAGMFAILGIIALWAIIVASFSGMIGNWPRLVQVIFYVVAGIIWIFPVRPLLVWMETGRWRA